MSNKLNQAREKALEPKPMAIAMATIQNMGYPCLKVSNKQITFIFKGEPVSYFPYSGWAMGKNITAGRGLKNLLSQIINDEH